MNFAELIRYIQAQTSQTSAVEEKIWAMQAQMNAQMQAVTAQVAAVQVAAAREAPALAVRIVCPVCTKALWSGMCRSGGDLRNANWTAIEPHLRKHVADDGVASATVTVEVMVDL